MPALRYSLEIAMIIPAVIFALMPVIDSLKVKPMITFGISGSVMAVMIFAGSIFGVKYGIGVGGLVLTFSAIIFVAYMFAVDSETGKKLFCFFNSAMLCMLCPMYTIYINAPYELANDSGIWLLSSGIICLLISVIIGAIFFRTLTVKFPMLMKEDSIREIWRFMYIIPIVMTAAIYWMTPISPAVVMTGRVRPIGLMLVLFLTAGIFFFLYIFWWIVSKITERAKLQQENDLLTMESKRYREMRSYMEVTRGLRHDFRQHIFVMSELSEAGRIPELEAYIAQLAENAVKGYRTFCANSAVDAIASHYDGVAEREGAKISWRLELPHTLPVKEPEYCAMLGNLIENALKAVKNLPQEKRKVAVISSMLSNAMLGLSIDNEYSGEISFGENGLPDSGTGGHGMGLISVMNTVNHYSGTMNISTENNIFSVDIILYL